MKTIVWTELALHDYHDNIAYLLREWSDKEAHNFINDVESVIVGLEKDIVEFKESGYKDIMQCVVCKQITLYYLYKEDNQSVLLRFWNTYQDSKNLKF